MSTISVMQAAAQMAVDLLNSIGTTCHYTPKDESIPIVLKVMTRELGSAELIGDYRQGDLRVELDAVKLNRVPVKYDQLKIGSLTYSVKDPNGSPRRVGDKVYTYKFVVRGA